MPDEDTEELEHTNQEQSEDDLDQSSQTPEDQQDVEEDFPESPEEQRKAFIAMRREIKTLKDTPAAVPQVEVPEADEEDDSVLDDIRYGRGVNFNNQQPITADTDLEVVTSRMTQAEKAAFNAEQRVSRLEAEREDEQAFNAYPELKTDKKLLKRVKREYGYLKLIEGKPVRVVDVAREIIGDLSARTSSIQQESLVRAETDARKKEAASLEARGNSVNQPRSDSRLEDLKAKAAAGDAKARIELIKETTLSDW